MKNKKSILAIAISIAMTLVILTGCQSATSGTVNEMKNTKSNFTEEQIAMFNYIYECEHTEDQIKLLGEDSVKYNEEILVKAYILQEVLPENGVELYMDWRAEAHS